MSYRYVIEVENAESIEKLKSIAAENGIAISFKKSWALLADALNEVASKGGLPSFGDASEWQSQERQDRQLDR